MKRTPMVFGVLVFVFFWAQPVISQSLDWEIQFRNESTREYMPINEIIKMENYSGFSLAVKPDSDSYCYVIFYDSDRETHVLENQVLKGGIEKPLGPWWIEEPSGVQTMYVVMSRSRQTDLEGLMALRESNPDSRLHSNNLYREIVSLQNRVSSLGEPASAIVTGGGTTRGADTTRDAGTNSQILATRFSGKEIYVRPIRIGQ